MALETSESPSPSMSSPLTSVESLIRLVDGEEAIAAKPAAVRNEISLVMLNPTNPGLAVVPVICMLMKEVGMLFQEFNEPCMVVVASATLRNGAPKGLGIGLSVVFMLYRTGMLRASQRIPITLAKICPGIGEGAPAVTSILSRAPPARILTTLISTMHVVNKIEVSFLIIYPPKETLLVVLGTLKRGAGYWFK